MVAPNSSLAVMVSWKGWPAILAPPVSKLLNWYEVRVAAETGVAFNNNRKKSIVIEEAKAKNFLIAMVGNPSIYVTICKPREQI